MSKIEKKTIELFTARPFCYERLESYILMTIDKKDSKDYEDFYNALTYIETEKRRYKAFEEKINQLLYQGFAYCIRLLGSSSKLKQYHNRLELKNEIIILEQWLYSYKKYGQETIIVDTEKTLAKLNSVVLASETQRVARMKRFFDEPAAASKSKRVKVEEIANLQAALLESEKRNTALEAELTAVKAAAEANLSAVTTELIRVKAELASVRNREDHVLQAREQTLLQTDHITIEVLSGTEMSNPGETNINESQQTRNPPYPPSWLSQFLSGHQRGKIQSRQPLVETQQESNIPPTVSLDH